MSWLVDTESRRGSRMVVALALLLAVVTNLAACGVLAPASSGSSSKSDTSELPPPPLELSKTPMELSPPPPLASPVGESSKPCECKPAKSSSWWR